MRITFSVPKKKLKKYSVNFSADLERSIPEARALLDTSNGYLVLDLAPDADPIDVTERLYALAQQYGIKPVRVPNEVFDGSEGAEAPRVFAEKPVRTVKMSRHIVSLIAVALICSALMFYVASALFGGNSVFFDNTLGEGEQVSEDYADKIALVDFIFENYGLYSDADGNLLLDEMLHAYVASTGDKYAAYYTKAELEEMLSDMEGSHVGIGVTVTWDADAQVIAVIQVVKGSPAAQAGVLPGDKIVAIGTLAENERVSALGYKGAMQKLLGEEGTEAKFVISRSDTEMEFAVLRAKFTAISVEGRQSVSDPTVGIVRISGFETTTPEQFKNEMGKLLNAGCQRFVYDLRNNPGGEMKSVCAMLSFFANENDVLVSTVTKQGNTTYHKAEPVTYTDAYAPCSIKQEEIGIYRGYPAVVISNGSTASAGELFTAALRDFGLADVVGENTYGKGVFQTIYDLSELGKSLNMEISGGLKLTVGYYTPPCGVNYDGVGIAPSVPVSLSEQAKNKSLYLLREDEDDQLLAAINNVKTK